MQWVPRASVLSREGTFEIDFSNSTLASQLNNLHGTKNFFLVRLLIICWVSLLNDSPVDPIKPNRVIRRFYYKITNDLFGTIASFAKLADMLSKGNESSNSQLMLQFIKEFRDTPIFREYLEFFKTGDPTIFRFIYTFLLFGKKIYYEDSELNTVAFRDWLALEDRMANTVIPPWSVNLKDILAVIFKDWDYEGFFPKHGSGSVAEKGIRGVVQKCAHMFIDPSISYLYLKKDGQLIQGEGRYDVSSMHLFSSRKDSTESYRVSRLKFVPKDWKKTRSICMEPVIFQWAQQGVRLWYEDYLSKCCLRNYVDITNQGKNQYYAYLGSIYHRYDTIDLSSASDSVSWLLCKSVFPPKVLKHLAATRTHSVLLPTGEVRRVSKFSPMGSALCFPVQSTLYAAICLMVGVALHNSRDWRQPNCFKGLDLNEAIINSFYEKPTFRDYKLLPFTCYGDDIICDKQMTSNVIECLGYLGFTINVDKSFTGNNSFRESCGKYYLSGNDVSPLIFKTKKIDPTLRVESVANLIELANRAFDYNYLALRKVIINFVLYNPIKGIRTKALKKNPIIFSDNRDLPMSIYSMNSNNTHLKSRSWKTSEPSSTASRFQCDEYCSIDVGPRLRRKYRNDIYRYDTWWRSRYSGGGKDSSIEPSPATVDTQGISVRWRWTSI
jgi:hypothetical protein